MMPTATTIAITLHQKRPAEIAAKMGDVFLGRWQVFPGCEVAFVGDVSHRFPPSTFPAQSGRLEGTLPGRCRGMRETLRH